MPDQEMETYSDPDGDEVVDGCSFATGTEWFDDSDEPTRLHRQRWVCVADETGTYYPPGLIVLCPSCDGEGCPECYDSGEDLRSRFGFVPDGGQT